MRHAALKPPITTDMIERRMRAWVGPVRLHPDGERRWRVRTPWLFADGDEIIVLLVNPQPAWRLTDAATTAAHLTMLGIEPGPVPLGLTLLPGTGEITVPVVNRAFGQDLLRLLRGLQRMSRGGIVPPEPSTRTPTRHQARMLDAFTRGANASRASDPVFRALVLAGWVEEQERSGIHSLAVLTEAGTAATARAREAGVL